MRFEVCGCKDYGHFGGHDVNVVPHHLHSCYICPPHPLVEAYNEKYGRALPALKLCEEHATGKDLGIFHLH